MSLRFKLVLIARVDVKVKQESTYPIPLLICMRLVGVILINNMTGGGTAQVIKQIVR